MATLDYCKKSTCTFLWKIENVHYLWMKKSQKIESAVFKVEELENTEWVMRLYPRGDLSTDKIGFYLRRKNDGSSTSSIYVYHELAFLSKSGKILWSYRETKHAFFKRSTRECFPEISLEEIVRNKSKYLPLNTLTARCKIWRWDGKDAVDKYFLAETRVAVQRRFFQWEIEQFSTMGHNEKKHLVIRSITNEILITFDLYFNGGQLGEEVIDIGIRVFNPNAKYLTFKTFVLDSNGSLTNCGMEEFVWEGSKKKRILTLLLSKKQLLSTEIGSAKYLKNDVLTLCCECNFSTGISSETVESVDSGIASLKTDSQAILKARGLLSDDEESEDGHSTDVEESEDGHSTDGEEREDGHSTDGEEREDGHSTDGEEREDGHSTDGEEREDGHSTDAEERDDGLSTDVEGSVVGLPVNDAFGLREDLGSLCCRDDLSDMKIRTNTTSIAVHTQILGARSSVFKAMFSNDMKEKTQGCVDVTDLDDDTVRRMLRYMYTDKMDNLQWESACQLYAASDKYDIASLRKKCTAILQAKLSPTNACQILSLADAHHDKALKKTVQDYIIGEKKTIFSSEEWRSLMDTNLRLAAETMHLKWTKD
ncbi:speckle-type POZ protein [Trichonephila clavata]|uniref:Speckle-type POZ protein n=1 Tax=Trichonephila clavata TaxID=2740835 RepID=A0A8X6HUV1_TRICU|nr:speckle-type POZ protein [Trichonephila clavata]